MTESMLTTRLSCVITGCGSNDITCSRRSAAGRTRSTNGIDDGEPRRQRARVAAEPLDDSGARLRNHPHCPRERDEHEQHDHASTISSKPRDTSSIRTRGRSPPRSGSRRRVWPSSNTCPSRYERADHSSPPMRTRPPTGVDPMRHDRLPPDERSRCRCARAPACAHASARSDAGRRARAEPRRETRSGRPPCRRPSRSASAAAAAARATGPRKNSPGVSTSPIAKRDATTPR